MPEDEEESVPQTRHKRILLGILHWLPIVILMGIFIFCYYAYVVVFCCTS